MPRDSVPSHHVYLYQRVGVHLVKKCTFLRKGCQLTVLVTGLLSENTTAESTPLESMAATGVFCRPFISAIFTFSIIGKNC